MPGAERSQIYFLRTPAVHHLDGIPVGIDSNQRLKLSQIQFVKRLGDCRHQERTAGISCLPLHPIRLRGIQHGVAVADLHIGGRFSP